MIHLVPISLLCLFATAALALTASLALTIAFTLGTEVITEHRAEDKVLFWCELVKRASDNQSDSIETFLATKVEIEVVLSCRLHHKINVLTTESLSNKRFIFFRAGEQDHLAHTFLVFVDMIGKNL